MNWPALLWSVALSGCGLVSLRMTRSRRHRRLGWYIGLVDEVLWCLYATLTEQYGFWLSALAYAAVYASNLKHEDVHS